MIKKLVMITALAMLLGSPTSYATIVSGNDLLKMCASDPTDASCIGYIYGVYDRNFWDSEQGYPICFPKGSDAEQMAKVVVKKLNDSPEILHVNASVIVVGSLANAFPCPD